MKRLTILLVALMLTGCTTKTQYGECIGAFDNKKPDLEYKLSALNLALAVIFSETIVVPVVVVADETRCPVGKK